MKYIQLLLILVPLLLTEKLSGQYNLETVVRLEDGIVVYSLDPGWTEDQKNEVTSLFGLDSTVWDKIVSGLNEIMLDSVTWNVTRVNANTIEISKKLERNPAQHLNIQDIFMIDENWRIPPGYVDQEKVIFGFNSFSKPNVFRYVKGTVHLFLPGYENYFQVYIAGSFNNWDPAKTLMQKVDSGWMVQLTLPPGKYLYKYVADGRWITDPNNRFQENDGQGNINSVFYCPNHQFKLNGYPNAKRVLVAGSFNNWNRNEMRMHRSPQGWVLPLYLKNGTYPYKFLVDNTWVTDPENQRKRTDSQGNVNSVLSKGEEYQFALKGYPAAKRIVLTGNFNNWNTEELLMEKTGDLWQTSYALSPGNYEYKYIVDGIWITDPQVPFTTGKGNKTNTFLAVGANHTFSLQGFEGAGEVLVTGTFNGWSTDGYHMVNINGTWKFPLYLSKGKHLYKFIVDGKWIIDPGNKNWEQNEHGTGNSVLWIR